MPCSCSCSQIQRTIKDSFYFSVETVVCVKGFWIPACYMHHILCLLFFSDLSPNDIQDAANIFQVKYTPFEEVWARLQEQYRTESKNYSHIFRLHINTWTFTVFKYTWLHSLLRYRYHQQWVMNDSLLPK